MASNPRRVGRFISVFEPTGDLFGRPSFGKAIANEGRQPVIFFQDGFTPPARHRLRRREAANSAPLGRALRRSSREIVALARPSALAIAPTEWPAAVITAIWSLSSSRRCE